MRLFRGHQIDCSILVSLQAVNEESRAFESGSAPREGIQRFVLRYASAVDVRWLTLDCEVTFIDKMAETAAIEAVQDNLED